MFEPMSMSVNSWATGWNLCIFVGYDFYYFKAKI